MVRRALSPGAQPERAQAAADGPVRASQQLGETSGVERVVQAQQLVLIPRPPPSAAGSRPRRRRADPKPPRASADCLWCATEALSQRLERALARGQRYQALVVAGAPAPRVADQPEPPRPRCHARRVAVGQLAGDLGIRECAGVAVTDRVVLPSAEAPTQPRVVQPDVLGVQAQRIGRAAKAVRQLDEVAADAEAELDRLVFTGQVRSPRRGAAQELPATRANLLG